MIKIAKTLIQLFVVISLIGIGAKYGYWSFLVIASFLIGKYT
jgi:hypothetical protein